ncbi:MAG: SAM-dependent methyltransferase [Comamonadaceae bacterium]|nr:MAG: SAM-dependent methyltransferase [Comamonadaceae bacterium]
MTSSRTLHLIPVGLGDAAMTSWLPEDARAVAARLTVYIAENAKTARAFLKLVEPIAPLQDITIHTLSPKTTATEITAWLKALPAGCEIGLVSEAGCPAVADPGAQVVELAHTMGITVQPWVGPSSILLGLMASGLSGQQFAFHGYAPIEPGQRAKTLKAWELDSARHRQTQMLIETPYRNMAMFATLLASLKGDTRLCIARSLTTPEQYIMTRTIRDWKKAQAPELDKQPTLFLFMAH